MMELLEKESDRLSITMEFERISFMKGLVTAVSSED